MLRRLVHRISVAAVMTAVAATLSAGVEDLPVKEINGRNYHYYEVSPKETVYSLTRQLGITLEELYETNPSTKDGLKAYSTLLFPVKSVTGSPTVTLPPRIHKVKKGETVYGISKMYGVTTDQIYEWNPGASDGIKTDQELKVSAPTTYATTEQGGADAGSRTDDAGESERRTVIPDRYEDYVVRDKETFYSIARAHGLTIHELEAANPGIGILKSGQTIRIPARQETDPGTEHAIETESGTVVPADTGGLSPDAMIAIQDGTQEQQGDSPSDIRRPINIALTLPIMATSTTRSRQADMYLDFYKGFLIAVDSMRHCGSPINIRLIDTNGVSGPISTFAASNEFPATDVVIGPDNDEQLDQLAAAAMEKGVFVFNPFVVKDESYQTNPKMLQANIPQAMMYDKAIDGLITRYADCLPVFVSHKGGNEDKSAFVSRLKERLSELNIDSREISYTSQPEMSELMSLPTNQTLMFIPTGGRQAELNTLLPLVVELKNKGRQVMVFGYPEWTTFRGETLKNMHTVGTVVYSRFFTDEDEPQADSLDGRFVYWYGKPMMNVLPRQGILGFDTGMYLINAVRQTRGDLSMPASMRDGIQNGFHFVRPAGSEGYVNDVLYFINYRPGGTIDRTML